METFDKPTITAIYRYPVKGLSPDPLESVSCTPGETLPFDRAYAIENGPSRFDPAAPSYLPKNRFLMLMRDERLATLQTAFDEETRTLTILRGGKPVATGCLDDPTGCKIIEQFMSAYMNFAIRGAPKILHAPGHSFSDVPAKCLHIVNMASVRDLERTMRKKIDPLRFRANLYIDGLEAWSEFKWLHKPVTVGEATLTVFDRTQRCDATNVDPKSGMRDMNIPTRLARSFGHSDFGVYARVAKQGRITIGDGVTVESPD